MTNESEEHAIWGFLYKELAKLKVILDCYEKLLDNIEQKNNRYNAIFQIILDSFSSFAFVTLSKFFDRTKGTWSLYRFKLLDNKKINEVKVLAQEFIDFRNNRAAHFSKSISHKNNFIFITDTGVKKIRNIIEEVNKLMAEINTLYGYDEGYALVWIGADDSIDNMLDDLKNYDHMKAFEESFK